MNSHLELLFLNFLFNEDDLTPKSKSKLDVLFDDENIFGDFESVLTMKKPASEAKNSAKKETSNKKIDFKGNYSQTEKRNG